MFLESWFAAGVIDSESAAAFARYSSCEPGRSPRHWRWLAFQDHLEEHTPLDSERCRELFQLGEAEPDSNLGTAMMSAILYQRHCPPALKQGAEQSPITGVRRAAIRMRPASVAAAR